MQQMWSRPVYKSRSDRPGRSGPVRQDICVGNQAILAPPEALTAELTGMGFMAEGRFSASLRRNSDRVAPVRRASSDSCGNRSGYLGSG